MLPRRVVGRHGARLRQDRRQADAGDRARQHRSAARVDGDLQRLRRSRAGVHHRRQLSRRRHARQRRELVPQRPGHGADRARLREMGRRAGLVAGVRRIDGPRLQDRDDPADGAGADRAGSRAPVARAAGGRAEDSKVDHAVAAGGRTGCRARSGPPAGRGRESAHQCGPHGANAERHHAARRAGGSCCRRRSTVAATV